MNVSLGFSWKNLLLFKGNPKHDYLMTHRFFLVKIDSIYQCRHLWFGIKITFYTFTCRMTTAWCFNHRKKSHLKLRAKRATFITFWVNKSSLKMPKNGPLKTGQTVLPDRSVLIQQKLFKNVKIQKFICDNLGHFQTLWVVF